MDLVVWVSQRLSFGDAHYLAPEFPTFGEGHQFAFEDILDGERFRKAWGYLDVSFVDPREVGRRDAR